MAEDFYDDYDDAQPRRRDHLFLWTVFILLLIGVAFACWIGSFYIFGHPEQPRAYRLLLKLKKLEPLRRFEVVAAPQGDFLTAQKLFDRYATMGDIQLENENAELMRIYVKNYAETKRVVPYVRGSFTVLESHELTPADLFTHGTVALMQAEEFPQILLEHIFPTTGSNLAESKRLLTPGSTFPIEKTNDVTALIHVARIADGRLLLTLMPLHYPVYALKDGAGTFASEPPTDLNIEVGFPVLKIPRVQAALQSVARLAANEPAKSATTSELKGPELVRVDTPESVKVPATGAVPEVPVATPIPLHPPVVQRPPPTPPTLLTQIRPSEMPTLRPAPVEPAERVTPAPAPPVAPPVTAPPVTALATPLPSVSPSGVPLKSFVKSNTPPGPPAENAGVWRTFPAGQLPPGRAVTPEEIGGLADHGELGERLYLRGNFLVTASGDNKAVLRPQSSEAPAAGSGNVRVIVDFPTGAALPAEGATFARDAARGFQVVEVRRGGDGTVNVFVREIAQP